MREMLYPDRLFDMTKSIAAAAAIWRQLAPTQDALAQDGLAFLRKTLK